MKLLAKIKEAWLGLPEKIRAIVYLIPLFVFFLPGLLIDSGRPQKAAIRSFALSVLFLLIAFLIFLVHYYIWKQSYSVRYFRDLFFFALHLVAIVGYVGLSGLLIASETKDQPPENFIIDKFSRRMVRFLEFKS